VFTGIVQETGRIASVRAGRLVINAREVLHGIVLGGSIAVNGVCLTVTGFDAGSFSADIMAETLRRTNLGQLHTGDRVNMERALALGGELGGHLVQGHIDDTGTVSAITREGEATLIRLEAPPEVMRFIVSKGFIAVDGISLTVMIKDALSFWVSVVGYSRQHTTLDEKKVGDTVNLEIDIISKYVEQFIQPRRTGITADFLQEHGFMTS